MLDYGCSKTIPPSLRHGRRQAPCAGSDERRLARAVDHYFPPSGHYALDPKNITAYPAAGRYWSNRIGELADYDCELARPYK